MNNPVFLTCTVRDDNFARTLSIDNLKVKPAIEYFYTWVQIEESAEYDSEVFCIFIEGQWHQAQSIDFNF